MQCQKKPRKRDEKRRLEFLQKEEEQSSEKREKEREQKAEELQKERELCDLNIKRELTDYLKISNHQIIFSLFRDIKEVYNKKNNVPKVVHISKKNYRKFDKILEEHIKAYYFIIILNQLLEKGCITINLEKYKKNCKNLGLSKIVTMCGDKITVFFKKMQDTIPKFGITVSQYLDYVPSVNNIQDIEDDLVAELPDLYESLLREQLKTESVIAVKSDEDIVNFITPQNVNSAKTAMNDVLYEKVTFSDCHGKKYTSGFLEKIMEKHGYKEKVDQVIEKLIAEYQSSPNISMEAAYTEPSSACTQIR